MPKNRTEEGEKRRNVVAVGRRRFFCSSWLAPIVSNFSLRVTMINRLGARSRRLLFDDSTMSGISNVE